MRHSAFFALTLLTLALAGCAGYTLGPTNGNAAGEKSVQVTPFVNQTLEPHLTDSLTTEIRKRLQQDGTYKLATRDDSDIILTGVITSYSRYETSVRPGDTFTARDYRLTLTAVITACSRTTGNRIISERIVKGYTSIRVDSDMTGSERQALPLLAADLAKNIVAILADGSW